MKNKFITSAAAAAAIIALGAGCASTHQDMASNETFPMINHGRAAEIYQTSPAMGATGNIYETDTIPARSSSQWNPGQTQGAAAQWQTGQDVVVLRDSDSRVAQGAAPSNYGQTVGVGVNGTITQMNDLCSSSDRASLAGRQVNLSDVKIQKVLSDRLVTVASDKGTVFFVRIDQPATGLREGQMIALNGTVRGVPSDPSSLGWDRKSARAIQGQQIVIEVPSVQVQ